MCALGPFASPFSGQSTSLEMAKEVGRKGVLSTSEFIYTQSPKCTCGTVSACRLQDLTLYPLKRRELIAHLIVVSLACSSTQKKQNDCFLKEYGTASFRKLC